MFMLKYDMKNEQKKSSEFGVTIKLFYCHLGRSNQVAYNMWLFDVGGLAHQISAALFLPGKLC